MRRHLRYFIESILFTYVPASLAQLGYFVAEIGTFFAQYSVWVPTQNFLRMMVCVFSLHFGFLAIWWSWGRGNGNTTHTLGSTQSRAQPIIKSAADMSLLDWALGPIEAESKVMIPGKQLEAPAEEKEEHLADKGPQHNR